MNIDKSDMDRIEFPNQISPKLHAIGGSSRHLLGKKAKQVTTPAFSKNIAASNRHL